MTFMIFRVHFLEHWVIESNKVVHIIVLFSKFVPFSMWFEMSQLITPVSSTILIARKIFLLVTLSLATIQIVLSLRELHSLATGYSFITIPSRTSINTYICIYIYKYTVSFSREIYNNKYSIRHDRTSLFVISTLTKRAKYYSLNLRLKTLSKIWSFKLKWSFVENENLSLFFSN